MSQRGARTKPEDAPAQARQRQGTAPANARSRDHGDSEFRFHRDGIRAGLAEIAERLGARPPPEEPVDPAAPAAELEAFDGLSAESTADLEPDPEESEGGLAEPEAGLLAEPETGLSDEPAAFLAALGPDEGEGPAAPDDDAAASAEAAALAEPVALDEAGLMAPDEPVAAAEPAAEPQDCAAPVARPEELRLLEALLFAASEPVEEKVLAKRLPPDTDVRAMLKRLALEYAPRGINLVRVGHAWAFRTANDLAWLLTHEAIEPKKLSRAATETLAIIAYHQPVTRAEIEDIRGVAAAKGTLDVLLETGWIRPRGRRKAPGRPLTFGTTEAFLSHFGLEQLTDLPGLDELKGAGLFDGQLPAGFNVPAPSDDPALREDEDPLEPADLDLGLAPRLEPEAES